MNTTLHFGLTEEIKAKLDLLLFSQVELRVPKGAYKAYLEGLITRDLKAMQTPCPQCRGTGIGASHV